MRTGDEGRALTVASDISDIFARLSGLDERLNLVTDATERMDHKLVRMVLQP